MRDIHKRKPSLLKGKSVFIGTPMYGGSCSGYYTNSTIRLSSLCSDLGIPLKFAFLFNESLITRARNTIVASFLKSGCSHLLFVDADINYKATDVLDLLCLSDTNHEVLCAPYSKKDLHWDNLKLAAKYFPSEKLKEYGGNFVFNIEDGIQQIDIGTPAEIKEGGTGFMLLSKSVFEKHDKEFPSLSYSSDHTHNRGEKITAYFDTGIVDNRYLSEDYYFCRNIRKAGVKIWLCPWIELGHVGSYLFSGSLQALSDLEREVSSEDSNSSYTTSIGR